MKYKKYIIMPMMLALLSVATSCEQEELPPAMPEGDVVEVTAAIGDKEQTRVSQTADNVYTFDHNDKIHIVGWHGDLDQYNKPWEIPSNTWWNDAVSTYNSTSGKWNTEPYMRWQNGVDLYHHFIAWWPENIIKSNENLTAVDITVTGDYNKDDILVASWSGKRPEDNVLNLEFKHLLSRFDVHLDFCGEYPNPENISIETNLKKTAVCDFLSGTVNEATEGGEGIAMQERPYPNANWDWSGTCITVPQVFFGDLLTIKFNASDEEKTFIYRTKFVLDFKSGYRTTLQLIVGKDLVELDKVTETPWIPIDGTDNLETE